MLEKIGNIENVHSQKIIEDFYLEIKDDYNGYLYAGYPIYNDMFSEEPVKVDSILISDKGVLIIHITQQNLVNYDDVQDNLYNKIEVKLKSYKFLLDKRNLLFDLNVISVCENSTQSENVVTSVQELIDFCKEKLNENLNDDLVKKINSAVQEAYGLGKRESIEYSAGTKSELISSMNNIIETHDIRQMEAILADPVGIQRIRGMAGSGKTIVLARKAVELHTAHPEWKILVTYNTRSVKHMLLNLIDRLYRRKNSGQKPNYENLIVMHGWGSASSAGLYYYLCKHYNVEHLNLNQAKSKFGANGAFEGVCTKLLSEIPEYRKLFDCILIDEAQDFHIPFFKLCLKNLDHNKRLVYAYDELQKLNEEAMPTPNKIFDCDIKIDTPLRVSYRNQSSVIVTAHAIGMGIYKDVENQNENLVQIPESNNIWEVIGYESENEVKENQEIRLYRTKETSPDYLNTDVQSLVKIFKFSDENSQFEKLIEQISADVRNEKVPVKEVMIIDMDTWAHKSNYSTLKSIVSNSQIKINVHLAGTLHPEDFLRDDSIVYSSILRAKGNETFVVYIVNSQESMSNLAPIKSRNELFTAITRSKGWVNILGYGEKMNNLENEFNKVIENNYQLYFKKYPSEEEKKKIRTTNVDLKKEDVLAIDSMEKFLKSLPGDKFDEIMGKFSNLKKD